MRFLQFIKMRRFVMKKILITIGILISISLLWGCSQSKNYKDDETTLNLPDYTLTPSLQSVDQIQSFGLISADGTIVEACSRVSGGYSVSFIQEDGTPVFGPVEGNVFLDIPKKLPSDCPVLKINDFELINKTGAEITDDYYIPFDPKDVLRIYDTPQEPGLYFRTIRTKSAGPIEDESIPAVAGELYLNYTYFFAVVVE